MTHAANAQETQLVVDHTESAGVLNPAAETDQRIVRDGAFRQLFDSTAGLTD
jgi:hypothetical protein